MSNYVHVYACIYVVHISYFTKTHPYAPAFIARRSPFPSSHRVNRSTLLNPNGLQLKFLALLQYFQGSLPTGGSGTCTSDLAVIVSNRVPSHTPRHPQTREPF